jgi:hypothetical protein
LLALRIDAQRILLSSGRAEAEPRRARERAGEPEDERASIGG